MSADWGQEGPAAGLAAAPSAAQRDRHDAVVVPSADGECQSDQRSSSALGTRVRYLARQMIYRTPLRHVVRRAASGHPSSSDQAATWSQALSGNLAEYLQPILPNVARSVLTAVLIAEFGREATAVLDLGCGSGALAQELAVRGIRRYLGVDISHVAIRAACQLHEASVKRYPQDCRFEAGSITEWAPERRGFDVAVFNEVLYYLPSPEAAVAEVERYRSIGGDLIIVSMKDDGKSSAIFRGLRRRYQWLGGMLYQEQPSGPKFRTRISREHPAFVIGAMKRLNGRVASP